MQQSIGINLVFSADTGQAKAQLQELKNTLNSLQSPQGLSIGTKTLTKDVRESVDAVTKLSAALETATNVDTGRLDLSKFSSSLRQSGLDLKSYSSQLMKLGGTGEKAFLQLSQAVVNAEVPLKKTSALIDDLWVTMKNTAKWQLSSSAIHGFMGALRNAYTYAQDLNESLNNIRIVTEYGVDQMSRFASEANKAAKALNTTTTDYTNASLIYYQQGLDSQQVKERTDITVKMANVTGESATQVSDYMTAVWNNFDDGSKSLEYYADVMTKLGAATASSTDEIAAGLEKFSAVAGTVGLSYEYATSALATVTAETRQSADVVGTAFKTLFARIEGLSLGETLEDGTDLNKYSQALATVGVNIKDASGEMKAMDTILEELGARWQTLAQDEKVALAQTVAGVRQYNQLISLMDNWDVMQENLGFAAGSEGTLAQQAEIYADSWEASSERVKASLEGVYNALINEDFFIDLNNGLSSLLGVVETLVTSLGGMPGVLALIASIATRAFGPQIANSINQMWQNFIIGSGIAKTQSDALKQSMIETLQALNHSSVERNSALDLEVRYQIEQIENTYKLQKLTKDLTEEEYIRLQQMMKLNDAIGQGAIEAQKTAESSKTEATEASVKLKEHFPLEGMSEEDIEAEAQKRAGRLRQKKTETEEEFQIRRQQRYEEEKSYLTSTPYQDINAQGVAIERTTKMSAMASANPESFDFMKSLRGEGGSIEELEPLLTFLDQAGEEATEAKTALEDYIKIIKESKELFEQLQESKEKVFQATTPEEKAAAEEEVKTTRDKLTKKRSDAKDLKGKATDSISSFFNDDKKATQGIERWSASVSKGAKNTKKAAKEVSEFGKKSREAGKNAAKSATLIDNQAKAAEDLQAALKKGANNIQNFGKSVGKGITGVSSLSMGIMSLKGALDSLSDPDMSFAEKMLTVFTSLGMALPSITSGFNGIKSGVSGAVQAFTSLIAPVSASTAATLLKKEADEEANEEQQKGLALLLAGQPTKIAEAYTSVASAAAKKLEEESQEELNQEKQEEIVTIGTLLAFKATEKVASMGTTGAKIAERVATINSSLAKTAEAGSTLGAAAAQWALNSALGPFIVLIGAVLVQLLPFILILGAIAAVAAGVSNAIKEQVEARKEAAQAAREEADAFLEEKKAHDELMDSYLSAYETYKETGKVTDELKTQAYALAKAYGVEGAALKALSGDYEEFTEMMLKAQAEEANEAIEKNNTAIATTTASAMDALREGTGHVSGGKYKAEFNSGAGKKDEEKVLSLLNSGDYSILSEKGDTGDITADVDMSNPMEVYQYYTELEQLVAEATKQGVTGSEVLDSVKEELEQGKEYFEEIKSYVEENQQLYLQASALTTELDGKSIQDIDNVEDYAAFKEEYIQTVKDTAIANGINEGTQAYNDLIEKANTYLTTYEHMAELDMEFTGLQNLNEDVQEYYKELSEDEKELFWQVAVNKQSSLENIQSFIEESQQYLNAKSLYIKISAQEGMKEALESGDFDALKEQYEAWNLEGKVDWEEFMGYSMQDKQSYIENNGVDVDTAMAETLAAIDNQDAKQAELDAAVEAAEAEVAEAQTALQNANDDREDAQSAYDTAYANYKAAEDDAGYYATKSETEEIDEAWSASQDAMTVLQDADAAADNAQENLDAAQAELEAAQAQATGYSAELAEQQTRLQMLQDQQVQNLGVDLDEFDHYLNKLKESNIVVQEAGESEAAYNQRLREVALAHKKAERGLKTLHDNWEDWNSVLSDSDASLSEVSKVVPKVEGALQDLFNLSDADLNSLLEIDPDFVQNNWSLIQDLYNDVEGAYNELGAKIAATSLNLPEEEATNLINQINSIIDPVNFDDVEIGATLDSTGMTDALQAMLNNGTIAADQMNTILKGIGFEPEIEWVPVSVGETSEVDGLTEYTYTDPVTGESQTVRMNSTVAQTTDGETKIPIINGSKTTYTAPPAPTLKNPGKNGGGGGSKSKPAKKVDKTKKSDVVERYKEINDLLDDMADALDKTSGKADRLYGKARIKAMREQANLMRQEIDLLKKKQTEAQKNLKIDEKALLKASAEAKVNIKIGEDGNISNYTTEMTKLYDELAAAEAKMDKMSTEEEQNEFKQKVIDDDIQKRIDLLKDAIAQYDETRELLEDLDKEITEKEWGLEDLEFETFTYEIELKIEIDDRELEYLEYLLGKIEDKAFSAGERISLITQQTDEIISKSKTTREAISTILGDNLSKEDKKLFYDGKIEQIDWQSYVDNETFTEAEVEALKNYANELLAYNEELFAMQDQVHEELQNSFAEWNEEIEKGIALFDHYDSVVDHLQNITDLTQGLTGYNAELNRTLAETKTQLANDRAASYAVDYENQKAVVDEMTTKMYQKDDNGNILYDEDGQAKKSEWFTSLSKDEQEKWIEDLEVAEESVRQAEENLFASTSDAIQAAINEFEVAFTSSLKQMELALAGEGGFAAWNTELERQQDISERTLKTYQETYELSKLNRQVINSINDTDNIKAKQALLEIQEEIYKYQKDGTEMSQYELDYLQKKYELRLAEIALEEAQNAKSQVRMSRDSEGNWGYIYTADEDKIAEAEQSYEDKLYEITNLTQEYQDQVSASIIQTYQEFNDAMQEIYDRNAEGLYSSEKEFLDAIAETQAFYYNKLDFQYEQLDIATTNSKALYEDDWTSYQFSTNAKINSNKGFQNSFDATMAGVATGYQNSEKALSEFSSKVGKVNPETGEGTGLLGGIAKAYDNMETSINKNLGNISKALGMEEGVSLDLENFAKNAKKYLVGEEGDKSTSVKESSKKVYDQIKTDSNNIKKILIGKDGLLSSVATFSEKWTKELDKIIKKNEKLIKSINDLNKKLTTTEPSEDPENPDPPKDPEGDGGKTTQGDGKVQKGDKVKVKKGTKWYYDSYGTAPTGTAKDGTIKYINESGSHPYNIDGLGWVKKSDISGYDTGGYTGMWGKEGKLAFLHQKELVLNPDDTQNFLLAMNVLREITKAITLQSIIPDASKFNFGGKNVVEQDVTIHAEFPNVTDHNEIEMALSNLINTASQYANRK